MHFHISWQCENLSVDRFPYGKSQNGGATTMGQTAQCMDAA